ncbi:hypothetical protein PSE305_24130c [Pseudomonas aeruginosa]|nr:hypothetical protein PSE305_24130c [Pseudomonas aeruginosa]
MAPAGFRRRR